MRTKHGFNGKLKTDVISSLYTNDVAHENEIVSCLWVICAKSSWLHVDFFLFICTWEVSAMQFGFNIYNICCIGYLYLLEALSIKLSEIFIRDGTVSRNGRLQARRVYLMWVSVCK